MLSEILRQRKYHLEAAAGRGGGDGEEDSASFSAGLRDKRTNQSGERQAMGEYFREEVGMEKGRGKAPPTIVHAPMTQT